MRVRTRFRPVVWLFVLAFGVLMIVGGVHGHRSARADRAVVEREGRMDRHWEYAFAKRHRDGTFFICLGLFTARRHVRVIGHAARSRETLAG